MSSSNMFRISEESDHISDASTRCPSTDSDKNIAEEKKPVPVAKRKPGRPRFEEDIIQTAKPDYWKNHYHEKRTALIECPVCGQMTTKNNFSAHKKTMKCRLKGLEREKSMKCEC